MSNFPSFRMYTALALALSMTSTTAVVAAQQPVLEAQIVADKMCCKGCVQKVAAQLYALPGVMSVEADVPDRLVTVTAKPSPKLTLDRIWRAVEMGKGGPSKLVTPHAAYALTRVENLKPAQRLPAGRYSLEVRSIENKDVAQRIANQLYAIRDVENVSVDYQRHVLLIQSTNEVTLSPWALATAAEQASGEPTVISGPYGVLTIERSANHQAATALRPSPQTQGGVR